MTRMAGIVIAGQSHHGVQRGNNRRNGCFLMTTAVPWSTNLMVIV